MLLGAAVVIATVRDDVGSAELSVRNNVLCKWAHCAYNQERHDYMVNPQRVVLSACVNAGGRILLPDELGAYMGFKHES